MGFAMNQLKESLAENAKAAVSEVKSMEASDAAETSASVQTPPPTERPNAFSRPAPSSSQAPSPAAVSSPPPSAPAASARPSFGGTAPPAASKSSRPSFGTPPSANMPNVRAVFVRDPNKFGSPPSSSPGQAASAGVQMNPQALFEIVCTHRKMSSGAIEAAKNQARENPDTVMMQMRRIYDHEIAPNRTRHAEDLPNAREQNPGMVVFLIRKDDKERLRIMSKEDAAATGETLLDGAIVENIHAAASPFGPPSQLFLATAPVSEVVHSEVSEPVSRSPKP